MTDFNKFRWNDHPVRVALKDTAGAVASEMFNRANMDGTDIYVSQEALAARLKASVRTIRRAQKQLESLGLIRCVRKGSNLGRASGPSTYELTMPPKNTGHDVRTPDKNTGHLGSGTPDTTQRTPDIYDQNTGHPCPEHRTPVSALIDPLIDPGNKPGSLEGEADTEVSAEASIFDDRPETPSGVMGVRDNPLNTDPFGVGCLGEPDTEVSGHEADIAMSAHGYEAYTFGARPGDQPTESEPAMHDPFDPFGSQVSYDPTDDPAFQAELEAHFATLSGGASISTPQPKQQTWEDLAQMRRDRERAADPDYDPMNDPFSAEFQADAEARMRAAWADRGFVPFSER